MMRRKNQSGFALVETLVATAIIAAMLGVTFQTVQNGARQTRMIEDRRRAMLVAESQLQAVGAGQSSSFGETRGLTSGIRWHLTLRPFRSDQPSGAPIQLVSVSAGLEGEKRDLITLKTIRVSR
jgi:type II secretion system protein I